MRATPLVRKIAQELGVDLATVAGTGPNGQITESDVRGAGAPREGRREPLRGVRRLIAEHMARAHREVPAGHLGRGVRLHRPRPRAARSRPC